MNKAMILLCTVTRI